MVINLDQYRAAPAVALKNGTYGDDVTRNKWKAKVVYLFDDPMQRSISPELPEDLSKVDVDVFLTRVYALATQI